MVHLIAASGASAAFAFGFTSTIPGVKTTISRANNWNRENNFSVVSIDGEERPWLELAVCIKGGVTKDYLRYHFAIFDIAIEEFKKTFV